ncbi:hypothetical protein D3877_28910 [Azospirillum cavernae]|uniref:Uncharacterized protein n=1 Tax=Azospirillum cavernae TaxID=2320860 RepID=A0A418VJY9_9PROT|nr:hypothetical protein [Azospirillum cavernae]RJF76479.1 hypothetical protein D3877_28910 [Azospirillum cavernae]
MLDIIAEAIATLDAASRAEILHDVIDTKAEALIAAKIRDRINAILGGRRAIRQVTFSRLQCRRGHGDSREQNIDLVLCDGEATIVGGAYHNEGLHLVELKQYYDFDCARALKSRQPYRGLQKEIKTSLERLATHQHPRVKSRHVIMTIVRLGLADTGPTWKYTPWESRRWLLEARRTSSTSAALSETWRMHSHLLPPRTKLLSAGSTTSKHACSGRPMLHRRM